MTPILDMKKKQDEMQRNVASLSQRQPIVPEVVFSTQIPPIPAPRTKIHDPKLQSISYAQAVAPSSTVPQHIRNINLVGTP